MLWVNLGQFLVQQVLTFQISLPNRQVDESQISSSMAGNPMYVVSPNILYPPMIFDTLAMEGRRWLVAGSKKRCIAGIVDTFCIVSYAHYTQQDIGKKQKCFHGCICHSLCHCHCILLQKQTHTHTHVLQYQCRI